MAQSTANSGWIQSSFDDFLVSSSNVNKATAKKNSDFSSVVASPGKRKLSHRIPSSNNISKPASIVSGNPTFKKPTKAPKRRPSIVQQLGNQSFLDRYSPTCVADLALHAKKLKELKDRFGRSGGLSFLLISGPSGCGKLTALRTVAKECGYDVSEWSDPLHWREWKGPRNWDQQNGHSELVRASQMEELSSFLLRSSCISALDASGVFGESSRLSESGRRKLIIVKDLPNECNDKPDEFANMIRVYKRKVKKTIPVLVAFISSVNGGGGSNSHRLFSTKFLEEFQFDVLEFNAIANTILTRALRLIIDDEDLKIDKSQLDRLVETANGDIRFAVNELQLLHSGHSSRKTTANANRRDSTLLLFRALGRCLYSKRKEDDVVEVDIGEQSLPSHLADYQRPFPLDFDPDQIVQETGFQPPTFALFLEENMWDVLVPPAKSVVDATDELESIAGILDVMSQSDTMGNTPDYEGRDKMSVYEKSLPARAVAFYTHDNARRKKGTNTFKSMRRPAWLDIARKIRNSEGKLGSPSITVKNGSVSINEYVPFNQAHSRSASTATVHRQPSGSEAVLEEEEFDDHSPKFVNASVNRKDFSFTVDEQEIANISIEEYND